jgi:hypothetical protein
MITENIWYSGHNNYRKHTHIINSATNKHSYNTELLDVDTDDSLNINQMFAEHLATRQTKTVDVLYSGGVDSECIIRSCVLSDIPVRAVTLRLMAHGYAFNTHDLYYSERFCRNNNIEHIIVDLHADKFFENGDHLRYLDPYLITEPHVATHMWLVEQCCGFPVLGGDHSWPWVSSPTLSPHRHHYSYYDKFMRDNGIAGVGSMISHSLESNILFIKSHLATVADGLVDMSWGKMPAFKQELLRKLGLGELEPRMRSYGWEGVAKGIVIDKDMYMRRLIEQHGETASSISWNHKIANVIGGAGPDNNDSYS